LGLTPLSHPGSDDNFPETWGRRTLELCPHAGICDGVVGREFEDVDGPQEGFDESQGLHRCLALGRSGS